MKKINSILFFLLISHFCFSQIKKDTEKSEMDEDIKMATQWRYVVIAGASSDFNVLDISAKQISKKTNIVYDNGVMIYDKNEGMIEPKDSVKYDIDAGQYMPRRYEENIISIEMMHSYMNYSPTLDRMKMIIVTGIFENKEDADKQLKIIQTAVPSAYIKKKQLYMGCTH